MACATRKVLRLPHNRRSSNDEVPRRQHVGARRTTNPLARLIGLYVICGCPGWFTRRRRFSHASACGIARSSGRQIHRRHYRGGSQRNGNAHVGGPKPKYGHGLVVFLKSRDLCRRAGFRVRAEPKLKHQFNVREISFQLGCLSLVRNKLLHEFPLMTSNGLIPGTGHFLGYLIQAVLVRR